MMVVVVVVVVVGLRRGVAGLEGGGASRWEAVGMG